MNKKLYLYSFLLVLFLMFTTSSIVAAENTDNRLKSIEKKIEALESNISNNDIKIKEDVKNVLSISGDTVKYIGIMMAIITPFLMLLIGFQIFRSYQFEKEINDTRKIMNDEYEKISEIRKKSEDLIEDMKLKILDLKDFVRSLAAEVLQKQTPELLNEVKEKANSTMEEIRTAEMKRTTDLIKKYESLDLTLTPSLYFERGNIYYSQGLMNKAIANYSEAIKLESNNYEFYHKRGLAYHGIEQYKEAIKDYLKAIELNPKHPYSYSNLGACYRLEGDLDKSLQNLNKAIELNPKSYYSYYQRGKTYEKKGKSDLALTDYETSIKINPKGTGALTGIAMHYMNEGNYEKAKEYYLQDLEFNPDVSGKLNLAEAYFCLNDYGNAIKLAKEAVAESTDTRSKIFAQYSLVIVLILDGQNYDEDLLLLIKMIKEADDFNVGLWRFDDLIKYLNDQSIESNKANVIRKIIALLKKEIKPDDF